MPQFSTALSVLLCPLCLLAAAPQVDRDSDAEPSVVLMSAEEGAIAIRGSDDDVFLGRLQIREAAAMTGTSTGEMTVEQSRIFAREFFGDAVLDFTDDEARAVRHLVRMLNETQGENYPKLIRRSWKFVKTRRDLCGGFSFTRGDCIVFSQPTIQRFVRSVENDPNASAPLGLLLHEQLHVLQREQPDLFLPLYENVFGFQKANVDIHPWINERQVSNPDGTDENWLVTVGSHGDETGKRYWMGTILKGDRPSPRMGRDFSGIAVELKPTDAGFEMAADDDGLPIYRELNEFPELTARFPIRGGYDHPNEVAAYLLPGIVSGVYEQQPLEGRAAEILRASQKWFAENL